MDKEFQDKLRTGQVEFPGFVVVTGYSRELALQSVGEGWASLVNEVFDRKESYGKPITISQVKEKYGGLRIYTNEFDDEFDQFLYDVEMRSFSICEDCGKAGQLRGGGWYRTLCDEHANGRKAVEPF